MKWIKIIVHRKPTFYLFNEHLIFSFKYVIKGTNIIYILYFTNVAEYLTRDKALDIIQKGCQG